MRGGTERSWVCGCGAGGNEGCWGWGLQLLRRVGAAWGRWVLELVALCGDVVVMLWWLSVVALCGDAVWWHCGDAVALCGDAVLALMALCGGSV